VQTLRFYLHALRQLPTILGKAWIFYITLITSIGSTLGYFGIKRVTALVGWWQGLSPVWGAIVPVALVCVALFLVAVHRQFQEVERERDKLLSEKETEEQRAALKEFLAEVMREGEVLIRSNPSVEEAEKWVTKIRNLLLCAFLDTSEAELFLSDEGLSPLNYHEPLQPYVQTDAQKWIRRRLERIGDLIRRADSLRIRAGFNGRDYIVPD
jgi:hypothetical protein